MPAFSSATASATSPFRRVELFHSTASSVREATYFGMAFSLAAMGSSPVTRGQWAAKIS